MVVSQQTRTVIVVGSLSALVVLILCSFFALQRLQQYQHIVTASQRSLEQSFLKRAEETDRNQFVEESKETVNECSKRARFEELLSKLATLSVSERSELDILFPECGDYQVRLKNYLILSLERMSSEYEIHKNYQEALLKPSLKTSQVLGSMRATVARERERAQLMRQQVAIQADIIALLAGRKVAGTVSISDLANKGNVLGGKLITQNALIDEERTKLQGSIDQ